MMSHNWILCMGYRFTSQTLRSSIEAQYALGLQHQMTNHLLIEYLKFVEGYIASREFLDHCQNKYARK